MKIQNLTLTEKHQILQYMKDHGELEVGVLCKPYGMVDYISPYAAANIKEIKKSKNKIQVII